MKQPRPRKWPFLFLLPKTIRLSRQNTGKINTDPRRAIGKSFQTALSHPRPGTSHIQDGHRPNHLNSNDATNHAVNRGIVAADLETTQRLASTTINYHEQFNLTFTNIKLTKYRKTIDDLS